MCLRAFHSSFRARSVTEMKRLLSMRVLSKEKKGCTMARQRPTVFNVAGGHGDLEVGKGTFTKAGIGIDSQYRRSR